MITALRVRDYRSFRGQLTIPMRRLTIALGRNNAAKTTALRLPLFINAAIANSESGRALLPLKIRGMDFGASIQDLVFQEDAHGSFELGMSYSDRDNISASIDFAVQLHESLRQESAFVSRFNAVPAMRHGISWLQQQGTTSSIIYDDKEVIGFRGVVPLFADARIADMDALVNDFRRRLEHTCHITSVRQQPLPVYELRSPLTLLSPTGEEVPFLLSQNPDVLASLAEWYHRGLGMDGLSVEHGTFSFRLTQRDARIQDRNLIYAGQGLQQVLPVAAHMCAMKVGALDHDYLAIEEPELHLHPGAHGAIADLAIEVLETSSAQLFIETHSEVLLLRLRRRVAEGRLSPHDLQFLWFDRRGDETTARPIEVNGDGSVSDWPSGVFAEDLDEVRGITRALRK